MCTSTRRASPPPCPRCAAWSCPTSDGRAAIPDLGERGSFSDRWDEVFAFHDDGAKWGIVALDQAVKSEPLIGTVEEAFNSSFDQVVLGPDASGGPTTPGTSDGGTDGGGTDAGADGGTGGGTDGGSSP